MARQVSHLRIKRLSANKWIETLKASVQAHEVRHGRSSKAMANALGAGKVHETRDVAKWMFDYRTLRTWEEQSGHTTGAHTKNTSRSTAHT